jgi:hypothetical protein
VRAIYRLLSAWGDLRAARRGPDALGRRVALAVPGPRRGHCTRLVALLSDAVDLLDDMAAGR